MFDGSTKTFELLKRPDTVQVVVVRGQKILLVDDEQPGRAPRLHLAGGRADDEDESWLAAAQRELREETGFVCSDWRLVDVRQPIPKAEWFVPLYFAQDITQELPQQLDEDGERITVQWHDYAEVRGRTLVGKEQTMQYALPLFLAAKSVDELQLSPAFTGQEVDR